MPAEVKYTVTFYYTNFLPEKSRINFIVINDNLSLYNHKQLTKVWKVVNRPKISNTLKWNYIINANILLKSETFLLYENYLKLNNELIKKM